MYSNAQLTAHRNPAIWCTVACVTDISCIPSIEGESIVSQ